MRRLFVVFALLGKKSAQTNYCAEHNIYLSNTPTTIGTTKAARCTAGNVSIPYGSNTGVQYQCPANTGAGMTLWGFDIQSACWTSSVAYAVATVDKSGQFYAVGLYYIKGPSASQYAGQLMVHTSVLAGTAFTPTGSENTLVKQPWTGCTNSSPCQLPAGQYALALETNCTPSPTVTCAALYGDDPHGFMYLFNVWFGGSSGSGPGGISQVNPAVLPGNCPQPSQSYPACSLQISSGLPATITPLATDPTTSMSGCANGCPKPPAVLIF